MNFELFFCAGMKLSGILLIFLIAGTLGQSPLGTCPESDGQQTTYLPDSQNCEYE
jgi:hypothetical protein